jgi:hypothetical protein
MPSVAPTFDPSQQLSLAPSSVTENDSSSTPLAFPSLYPSDNFMSVSDQPTSDDKSPVLIIEGNQDDGTPSGGGRAVLAVVIAAIVAAVLTGGYILAASNGNPNGTTGTASGPAMNV